MYNHIILLLCRRNEKGDIVKTTQRVRVTKVQKKMYKVAYHYLAIWTDGSSFNGQVLSKEYLICNIHLDWMRISTRQNFSLLFMSILPYDTPFRTDLTVNSHFSSLAAQQQTIALNSHSGHLNQFVHPCRIYRVIQNHPILEHFVVALHILTWSVIIPNPLWSYTIIEICQSVKPQHQFAVRLRQTIGICTLNLGHICLISSYFLKLISSTRCNLTEVRSQSCKPEWKVHNAKSTSNFSVMWLVHRISCSHGKDVQAVEERKTWARFGDAVRQQEGDAITGQSNEDIPFEKIKQQRQTQEEKKADLKTAMQGSDKSAVVSK